MVPPPPPPKKPLNPSNSGPASRDDLLADIRKGITLKRVRPAQGNGVSATGFSKSATLPRMAGENFSFNQSNHRTDPHHSQSPSTGTGFAKSGPPSNSSEKAGQNDEMDLDSLPPSSLAPPPYKEESQSATLTNKRPPPPSFPPPPPPLQNHSVGNSVPPPPPPLSSNSTNQRNRGFQSTNQNRSATMPKARSEAVIDRSALLTEIQRGAKLRKVVVNDKSAPILDRKGSGGLLLEQSENKPNVASPKGSTRMHDQLIDELKNRRKNSEPENSSNKIGLPKISTDFTSDSEETKFSSTSTSAKRPNFQASGNNQTPVAEKSGLKYDQKNEAQKSDNSLTNDKTGQPSKVADTILSFQRKQSSSAVSDSENNDNKNSHERAPPKISPKPISWNNHGRKDDDKSGQEQPGLISGERSPQLLSPQILLNNEVSRVDESKAATPVVTSNPSVVLIPPSPSNYENESPRRRSSSKKDSESSSGESVRSAKMFFNRSSTESESSSINDGPVSDRKELPDSALNKSSSGTKSSIYNDPTSETIKATKGILPKPKPIEIDDVDNESQGGSSNDGGSRSASPRSKPTSPNFQTSTPQPGRTSPLISTNNRSPSGLSSPTLANQRRPSPPPAVNQNQPKSPQLEKKPPSPLSIDVRDTPTDSGLISSSGKKMSPIGNSSSPSAQVTPQPETVFMPSTGVNYKSSRVDDSSDYSYVAKQVILSSSPKSGHAPANLHSGGSPSIVVDDVKPKLSSPAAAYVPTTPPPNVDSGTKNRGTNSSENLAEVARMNSKNRLNSFNSDRPQPTPTSLTGPKIDIESLIEAEKLVNPARFNEGPLRNSGVRKVSKNDVSTLINERLKERAIYDKLVTAVAATSGEDMPAFADFKQTLSNGSNGTLKQNNANKLISDSSDKGNNNSNNINNDNNTINNSNNNNKNSGVKLGQSKNTINGIGNTRKPSPPTVFAKPAKSGYLFDAENDSTNQNSRPSPKKSSITDQEPSLADQNHTRLAEWQQLSASRQGGTYELIEQAKREIETTENDRRMNERYRYQATVEDRLNETILANKSPITFSNPSSNSSSPAVTRKHVEAANQAAKRLWDTVNELEDSFPSASLSSGPASPAGNGHRPSLTSAAANSPNPYDSGSGVRRTGVGIEVKRSVGGGAFEEMPLVDRNSRGQYVARQRDNLSSPGSAPGSPSSGSGGNAMVCTKCGNHLNGKFVQEGAERWCPNCLLCAMPGCGSSLIGIGHIKIDGEMICENCFKKKLAPKCGKCGKACMTEIVDALGSKWHPECFVCAHCEKQFPDGKFLEHEGLAYCRKDWNELFGKKCTLCKQVVQAGELWVEVSGNVYHSNCFLCTKCQEPIHGEFISRNEKPYCKNHA